MTDHVAVLQDMREADRLYERALMECAAPSAMSPERAIWDALHAYRKLTLDHAIAAVAERDALVARLGELEKQLRDQARGFRDLATVGPNPRQLLQDANRIDRIADDLARVVAGNGGGDE